MDQRIFVVDHVLGHATRRTAFEAEHIMRSAHPVLAGQTVATLPTRNNLLSDDAVSGSDFPTICRYVVELDNLSDKLMARNNLRFGVGRAVGVTPELCRAVIT